MRKQAGSVDPLPGGEDPVEVMHVFDDEVEGLQPSVGAGIPEIDHPDVVGSDKPDQVVFAKIMAGLVQKMDQRVGVEGYGTVHDG